MTEHLATDLARRRIAESEAVLASMSDERFLAQLGAAAEAAAEALGAGHKLLLFGNGGSAADAAHIAAELVGRYLLERDPLPALALADNLSAVTAIGNDYGYEEVFARQVRALGVAGDVAIGLTTSGRSANVVRGLEAAAELGLVTIALTGIDPGPVGAGAEHVIPIPSAETPRIQEGQIVAAHVLCEWIEVRLAEGAPPA